MLLIVRVLRVEAECAGATVRHAAYLQARTVDAEGAKVASAAGRPQAVSPCRSPAWSNDQMLRSSVRARSVPITGAASSSS